MGILGLILEVMVLMGCLHGVYIVQVVEKHLEEVQAQCEEAQAIVTRLNAEQAHGIPWHPMASHGMQPLLYAPPPLPPMVATAG